MLNNQALLDFDSTAHEMLALLRNRLAFDLWAITRVEEADWIILYANDNGYGVRDGDAFQWMDSFCYRMVTQAAPRVVPDCHIELAYADAPIGRQLTIGAYIGIPLRYRDGRLFGTLCAIHPEPLPTTIVDELPLLEVLVKMLELVLGTCLDMANQARHLDHAGAASLRDDLTGLYSRRAWDLLLAGEEKRCRLYGHSACVISIHLNDWGHADGDRDLAQREKFLVKLSEIIQSTARKQDVVARVEKDKFAILAVESTLAEGNIFLERLELYLRLAQIDASIAIAVREPRQYRLSEVWHQAERTAGAVP